jgi:hypothetical protein
MENSEFFFEERPNITREEAVKMAIAYALTERD